MEEFETDQENDNLEKNLIVKKSKQIKKKKCLNKTFIIIILTFRFNLNKKYYFFGIEVF